MSDHPFRVLPRLDDHNRFFWTSGADGKLRFLRCNDCGYYIHPPLPQCPRCASKDITPSVVTGRGVVHSVTLPHQPWDGSTEPWSIVLVELDEQEGLRLTSNMVNCANENVRIGMPVHVVFQQYDDVFIPVFEPANE
ncbi:MAG TPA: OB-fold domain-containing protein [Acidimicrobiales bacterium]|nr:OB-fold domain-containing protein [Acidimicrobiales bacterium]